MRHQRMIPLLAALALLAACMSPVTPLPSTGQPTGGQPSASTGPASTPTPDRPLAALVNGQPIYLVDYERQVAQYQAALVASGGDIASQDGQQQVLQARAERRSVWPLVVKTSSSNRPSSRSLSITSGTPPAR